MYTTMENIHTRVFLCASNVHLHLPECALQSAQGSSLLLMSRQHAVNVSGALPR